MMRQVGSILSVLLVCCAFCSCSGQLGQVAPQQIPDREDARPPGTDTGQSQGLPAIAELDELTKETGAISSLNVLNPLLQRATTPQDGSLLLDSTAGELSYAIYAAHGIPGIPHFVKCEGQGSLWLMAADYSRQRWETASFDDDLAAIDLRQLGSPYSEEDLSYIALVCPRGSHALANKLWIDYDEIGEWQQFGGISNSETHTRIMWHSMPVERYEVYRWTGDSPIKYHVGTHIEQGGDWEDWNIFEEEVPDVGGKWVPRMEDRGTPEDFSDDFPAVAPEVAYHYRLVPMIGSCKGPSSPLYSDTASWGDRRLLRRHWPDSTNQTRLFGQMILPDNLTPKQHEWCGEHYALGLGLTYLDTSAIRVHNPDFITLGRHWAHEACWEWQNDGNKLSIVGDDVVPGGFYDRIDEHEDWFIHVDASTQYNQRVGILGSYGFGYYLDAAHPGWQAHLTNSLVELMGENHYDGWVLDGAHIEYGEPTDQFWPGEPGHSSDRLDYWRPRLLSMLENVRAATSESLHRPDPYIIASAADGLDYSPCDGIYLTRFAIGDLHGDVSKAVFDADAASALAWQNQGKAVLISIYEPWYTREGLFETYCCYQLLRGPTLYFSVTNHYQATAPAWYPEWGWNSGLPLDPPPETIADISFTDAGFGTEYYRRDFENGTVIVIPEGGGNTELWSPEGETIHYELLEYHGGGHVDDDGTVNGYIDWAPAHPFDLPGYRLDGPGAWIIRPTLPH